MPCAALGETIKNLFLNKKSGDTFSHDYLMAAEPNPLLQLISDDSQQIRDIGQVKSMCKRRLAGCLLVVHVSAGRQAGVGP